MIVGLEIFGKFGIVTGIFVTFVCVGSTICQTFIPEFVGSVADESTVS